MEAETSEERIERLELLIELGFIPDPALKAALENRIKSSSPPPQLGTNGSSSIRLAADKIQIFYTEKNLNQQSEAAALAFAIRQALPEIIVEVAEARDKASDNQIRFEPGREDLAAIGLQQLLKNIYPSRSFKNETVTTRSTRSLSIFLKTE